MSTLLTQFIQAKSEHESSQLASQYNVKAYSNNQSSSLSEKTAMDGWMGREMATEHAGRQAGWRDNNDIFKHISAKKMFSAPPSLTATVKTEPMIETYVAIVLHGCRKHLCCSPVQNYFPVATKDDK